MFAETAPFHSPPPPADLAAGWRPRLVAGAVVLIALLLSSGGCESSRGNWAITGHDCVSVSAEGARLGGDGSVAVGVRIWHDRAVGSEDQFRQWYVWSPDEIREIWRGQASGPNKNTLVLEFHPGNYAKPGTAGPGRFVPGKSAGRSGLPGDLPGPLRSADEWPLAGGAEGTTSEVGDVRAEGEAIPFLVIGGDSVNVRVNNYNYTFFRTPSGHVLRVLCVPLAAFIDVLYAPIYLFTYRGSS